MKAPVSWLQSLVSLPAGTTADEIARRWTEAGLNVERIEATGGEISGPVVIGQVLSFEEEPHKNGKVIRWCRVDVGAEHNDPAEVGADGVAVPAGRGIVCGASNFAPGDHVVVALPGSTLPGGFEIAARKTYGHISDGMLCATDELGLGGDHAGIITLPAQTQAAGEAARALVLGEDALAVLQARDQVIEADITPDTGYCLSMRGLARETAQAFGVDFCDPYATPVPAECHEGQPVAVDDRVGCPLFTATTISDLDPTVATPAWLARRLESAGMRSISLIVDITNYVMLESGQPMHAYDAARLQGPIVVRRALADERLVTLDGQTRSLRPGEDLLICDDSGAIGLAGVMGGASTEVSASTTTVVLEAATFDPVTIGRAFRAHRLPSEASKRFERGVDSGVAWAAAQRAATLMAELAGGQVSSEVTIVGAAPTMPSQSFACDLPARVLGAEVSDDRVVDVLRSSGCTVDQVDGVLTVRPPTWRPDLVDPYDFVEEVGRKIGFSAIGSLLPTGPAGRGLTPTQRARRSANRAAVEAGFVELITLPFIAAEDLDKLGIDEGDDRRRLVRLANPLSDAQPYLRTTLLPGLLSAVNRNTSRSHNDLALFEIGSVFRATNPSAPAPMPAVSQRPSEADIAALTSALPEQPLMLAAVVTGQWRSTGWRGAGVAADWTHVVALAEAVAASAGVTLTRQQTEQAPWHPGRCAALVVGEHQLGYAGELHPSVVAAWGLPERACAVELDLGALLKALPGPGEIRPLSHFPVAKEDVALVVDESVPAAEVLATLREGGGALVESVQLFDVYRSQQWPGQKSLAFALALRGETTLTDAEAAQAREAAVAAAVERWGAVHRS